MCLMVGAEYIFDGARRNATIDARHQVGFVLRSAANLRRREF